MPHQSGISQRTQSEMVPIQPLATSGWYWPSKRMVWVRGTRVMFWSMNMFWGIKIKWICKDLELPIQHTLQLSHLISKSSICSNKRRETGQLPISTAKIAPKAISSAWSLVSFGFLDTKSIQNIQEERWIKLSTLHKSMSCIHFFRMEVICNLQKLRLNILHPSTCFSPVPPSHSPSGPEGHCQQDRVRSTMQGFAPTWRQQMPATCQRDFCVLENQKLTNRWFFGLESKLWLNVVRLH